MNLFNNINNGSLFGKFLSSFKSDGFLITIKRIYRFALDQLRGLLPLPCEERRRVKLSKILYQTFDGTVMYGPFKGLKLDSNPRWSNRDYSSMLLGLYEKEILDSIITVPTSHRTFIDLGAADGYYGVGVLTNNLFDFSYCFEITKIGQKQIKSNTNLNNVSNRVKVFGKADENFYISLLNERVNLSKCVLLCDIEGGEFDLFSEKTFNAFKGSVIFIEIHEWHKNGIEGFEKLKQRAERNFKITEFTTGSRNLSIYPELKNFSDTDRWLICSEGRGQLMTFLRLDPK
ncbi:MAG: hypothetical protein OIN87_09455 [Candidatus Methanoperedens sp.]|nr:hypothetical protein [Candidatus Methanoperedens sp.]